MGAEFSSLSSLLCRGLLKPLYYPVSFEIMLFPKGQFILYFLLLMLFTASFGYILVPMKRDLPSHREKCQVNSTICDCE